MTTLTLEARALDYAKAALAEITSDPAAFGITEPWSAVSEWIDFELDGDAGDQFTSDEEHEAIISALWEVGDLDLLNAPFTAA